MFIMYHFHITYFLAVAASMRGFWRKIHQVVACSWAPFLGDGRSLMGPMYRHRHWNGHRMLLAQSNHQNLYDTDMLYVYYIKYLCVYIYIIHMYNSCVLI